jgi:hypothetical protein
MYTKPFEIKFGIAGLALALSSVGCSVAAGDGSQEQGDDVATETSKLVHSFDAGNGHTVEFYDFGEGQVAVKEQYLIGDKPLLDNTAALEAATLADMYRRVRAGGSVPEAIVAADLHAADTLSKPQVIHTLLPSPAAPADLGKVEQAATSCSADLFGDSWSAQWFIDNFGSLWNYNCGGDFVNVNQVTNQPSTHSWAGGKYVWLWKGFEGDFNVAGSFYIYRNGFGLPANIPIATGTIPPRNVVAWTIRGGWNSQTNHVTSKSTCGHAGMAQVWCGL